MSCCDIFLSEEVSAKPDFFSLVSREDQREPTYFPRLDLIHVERQEELGDPLQADAVPTQMQVPHPVLKHNHSHLHDSFYSWHYEICKAEQVLPPPSDGEQIRAGLRDEDSADRR